jgi:predicted dehydrogenase
MPLRVGLLGYGYVGKTFHAPLIEATDGLALAAVGSSDAGKVHADRPHVEVQKPDDVLTSPGVDLVVIATPNDTHYDLARRALLAGKHVVVDKPFTVTLQEAEALAELAETTGRVLSVFHNLRWNADFLTVRALVADGRLGEVMHFESHFDRYRPEVRQRWRELAGPGSGIWYDLGAHLVDQALQLFGPPAAVYADMAALRAGATAVDYFHVVLRYASGRRAVLHGSNLVPGGSPRFVLHGDRASYVKHGVDPQEGALQRGERPEGADWGRDLHDGTLYRTEGRETIAEAVPTLRGDWRAYYAAVRDAVAGRAPNPVPAADAVLVMRILERAVESAARACERPL